MHPSLHNGTPSHLSELVDAPCQFLRALGHLHWHVFALLTQFVNLNAQLHLPRQLYPSETCTMSKCMFLYSAVSSQLDHSKRFTLFLPWQTCSFRHQLDFSGKHSSDAAITREDYSLTFPPPSTARCSFIQLSELRHRGENENARVFKNGSNGGSNPGYLDCESSVLPLSHRAPYDMITSQRFQLGTLSQDNDIPYST